MPDRRVRWLTEAEADILWLTFKLRPAVQRAVVARVVERLHLGLKDPGARAYVRRTCRETRTRQRDFLEPIFQQAMLTALRKAERATTMRLARRWLTDEHGRKRQTVPAWFLPLPAFWAWLKAATYREATKLILREADLADRKAHATRRQALSKTEIAVLLAGKPSTRQAQILTLLQKKRTIAGVARELKLSESTCRAQLWRLRAKLGEAPPERLPGGRKVALCPECGGFVVRRVCLDCGLAWAVGTPLEPVQVRRARVMPRGCESRFWKTWGVRGK